MITRPSVKSGIAVKDSPVYAPLVELGRHTRFRFWRPEGHAGSIPVGGTTIEGKDSNVANA